MTLHLIEGQTSPVDCVLRDARGPLALGPTDVVALILTDQNGWPVDTDGCAAIIAPDPAAGIAPGTVRFTPRAGALHARSSPYFGRWKVTRASGTCFVPSESPILVVVGTP